MNHYYSNNPNVGSKEIEFNYTFNDKILLFKSDLGVFSKERVDFGTNVLINALPDLSDVNSALDMGCGIGIIGLCIKSKYKRINITLSDVNTRALKLAALNAKKNGLEANIIESSLYEKIDDKFDLIVSNPPIRAGKKIVFGVIEEGFDHLNEGGKIIVVIQKKQGADSLKKRMDEVFGNTEILDKKNGYLIIMSRK